MSYKRHWDAGKTGLASIYKKEDSACQGLEVSMLKLNKGMSENFFEKDKEIVFRRSVQERMYGTERLPLFMSAATPRLLSPQMMTIL